MSDRPGAGEQLAGIAGLVLILVMFLFAWYGVDGVPGFDAFEAFDDWITIILTFAAFSAMALALFGTDVARAPIPLSTITAVLGGISAVILLIYLISPPSLGGGGELGLEIELGRKLGIWLGLASSIAIAIGGFQAMQDEGTTFGDAADRFSQRGGTPPPPPPAQQPPPPPPPPSQQQPPPPPPGGAA